MTDRERPEGLPIARFEVPRKNPSSSGEKSKSLIDQKNEENATEEGKKGEVRAMGITFRD